MVLVLPMNNVMPLVRFYLPDLVQKEPKHAVFMNYLLKLTKGIEEIDPEKPFIIVVSNLSKEPRKIPNHIVLGYARRRLTLLIPVDSPLVSHVLESLVYISRGDADAFDKSPSLQSPPPKPSDPKSPALRQKLLNTPDASTTGPVVCP